MRQKEDAMNKAASGGTFVFHEMKEAQLREELCRRNTVCVKSLPAWVPFQGLCDWDYNMIIKEIH